MWMWRGRRVSKCASCQAHGPDPVFRIRKEKSNDEEVTWGRAQSQRQLETDIQCFYLLSTLSFVCLFVLIWESVSSPNMMNYVESINNLREKERVLFIASLASISQKFCLKSWKSRTFFHNLRVIVACVSPLTIVTFWDGQLWDLKTPALANPAPGEWRHKNPRDLRDTGDTERRAETGWVDQPLTAERRHRERGEPVLCWPQAPSEQYEVLGINIIINSEQIGRYAFWIYSFLDFFIL